MIKGVLLDYGGTIDTNGVHWAEVLWNCYQAAGIPVTKAAFREAYQFGEYSLATSPLVKSHHNFIQVLQLKIEKQFFHLQHTHHLAQRDYTNLVSEIAAECNKIAAECISGISKTLNYLSAKYPLVIVSNFYGNLETVLLTFNIRHYFQSIVESAVVGVRKPFSAIYSLGVDRLQLPANNCVVIGDSYSKDMVPGKAAGCQTIWLKKEGYGDDPEDLAKADKIIFDFTELEHIL